MLLALFLFVAQLLSGQSEDLAAKFAASPPADGVRPLRRGHSDLPANGEGDAGQSGVLLNLGARPAHGGPRTRSHPALSKQSSKSQPDSLPALISLGSARWR